MPQSHWLIHTLTDIVQGARTAGLTLKAFAEFANSIRAVDYDIYENQVAQTPMSFLLRAAKA